MQTYAQSQKKKPFDWDAFLKKAIKSGVTEIEHTKAKQLSNDWVTCACGNQCSILERDDFNGEPMDDELAELGTEFHYNISDREFKKAKETLKAIEKRSAYLINQKTKEAIALLKKVGYVFTH